MHDNARVGVLYAAPHIFWLALLKLGCLFAYFIVSIIYASGGLVGRQQAVGFAYWRHPGPFAGNGFRGVATVFVFCSTFYAGIESLAVAATETKNPGKAIPMATWQVFWRILSVCMGSAFFSGLTCPANAKGLAGRASRSPKLSMTIAIQNAGWEVGVHLINAFLFATCLSATNASIYVGSRTVVYMAQDGKAPKFLGWKTQRGAPSTPSSSLISSEPCP